MLVNGFHVRCAPCGRRFRTLNVIDDHNREALMVAPSFTLTAFHVIQLLDRLAEQRGYPQMLRVDNGPEYRSAIFRQWAADRQILVHYIQPGKPAQNGYIERFNRTYREDILDANLFSDLSEVKRITQDWLYGYNNERPHQALAGLTPAQFLFVQQQRSKVIQGGNSTLE